MLARQELARGGVGEPTALTVGVFDGVHRGHQHLIGFLKDQARRRGLKSAVVTLHPHPQRVLHPQAEPIPYLTSLTERLALLAQQGVDYVLPVTFTRELSLLSAQEFVALLAEALKMKALVVGPDFALGRGREGTPPVLAALGREMGIAVELVPPLEEQDQVISSTALRRALAEGDMAKVNGLLGRPFTLAGPVVPGAARGHSLGFPTANIALNPELALPAFGIYVTRAYLQGTPYKSVTNIGVRPTFSEREATVESYILDFQGDIYDQELRLEVLLRLRPEVRFDSVEALKAQIERDVLAAREALS